MNSADRIAMPGTRSSLALLTLILSVLSGLAAWWSGYNPFLWGLVSLVAWTLIWASLITHEERKGRKVG